jgi:hypothetical protein
LIEWELTFLRRFSPTHVFAALFATFLAFFRSRAALQIEILALRHQLGVLHRSVKRPKLTSSDRLLWAWLSGIWSEWRSALVIVKPETVVAWHRKGFRLFWTWRVRHGQSGSFEIWDHRHPRTAGGMAALLDSDEDECCLPALKLPASP